MARRVPLGTPETPTMLAALWSVALQPRPMSLVLVAQLLASANAAPRPEHPPARDSLRLVHRAHSAQSDFELLRREYLPTGYGGGSSDRCDARVGRFCYWNDGDDEDDDDERRPAESPRIARARTRLVAALDSIGALLPGDAWVAGQRVRYRLDAGDTTGAVAVAASCSSIPWWCSALAGLALHESGDVDRADSAFGAALHEMPEAERCTWTDLSLFLDGTLRRSYHRLGCAARDSMADRIWWLSAPLYLVGAADLRAEIFSRLTLARIDEDARSTQSSWGDDLRELRLRYGWPTWYSRVPPPMGSMESEQVVGHMASPSFDFLPAAAVDSPFAVGPDAFDFRMRGARVEYAPPYLRHIHGLSPQLAVFRRGDSALVVAALDVHGDTALAGHTLTSGLFLWSGPHDGTRTVRDDSATREVLTAIAPWKPLVIGVEVLAREQRRAARIRVGRILPPARRIDVSDLLLYAPGDSTPRILADVLPHALASPRVSRRDPLGVFWETYGLAPAGEKVAVSLTIAPIGGGWFRRAVEALRLAQSGTPMSVRWQETPALETGIASRGVTVDLSRLPAGHYRVQLTITPDGRTPVTAAREIDVVD